MPAQWLPNHSESSTRLLRAGGEALRSLAQPQRARRLRLGLMLVLVVWGIAGLARLLWALLPASETAAPAAAVINPVTAGAATAAAQPVDIERLVGWHLFGEAEAIAEADAAAALAQEQAAGDRDGIEDGARETRLELKLRGVVAATEDGLGHAIIEHRKRQQVYAVEDQLPVSGRVFLAKVMPQQVVLDNSGTYELLRLYEESDLSRQASRAAPARQAPSQAATRPVSNRAVDQREDEEASRMAADYRNRLYKDPQSLTHVVQVSAVREEGKLRGYRIRPGRDAEQFKKLGFKAGDMVVGVNGIALDNPSNTMRLYQVMRSAQEAVFELQRGEELITLSVNLEAGDGEG